MISVLTSQVVTLYVYDLQGQGGFRELEERLLVDIIRLGCQKAFDKTPHEKLLKKLNFPGIGEKVLSWSEIWLQDKKQKERQNCRFSGRRRVNSSVSQELRACEAGFIQHLQQWPGEGGRQQNPQVYGD